MLQSRAPRRPRAAVLSGAWWRKAYVAYAAGISAEVKTMTERSDIETDPKYLAIKEIDGLMDPSKKIRDRLGAICHAMLSHEGRKTQGLSNVDAVSRGS